MTATPMTVCPAWCTKDHEAEAHDPDHTPSSDAWPRFWVSGDPLHQPAMVQVLPRWAVGEDLDPVTVLYVEGAGEEHADFELELTPSDVRRLVAALGKVGDVVEATKLP